MKLLLCVAAVLLAAPSASMGQPKYDASLLVGIWRENNDTKHAIVWRRPDGTYQEKVYCLYDWNKPPLYYTASGTWKVRGRYYIITIRKISAEVWKETAVNKVQKLAILQIDQKFFKHPSSDNTDVEEPRIGDPSKTNFLEADLNLRALREPPLPPDWMKRVRKAIPVAPHDEQAIY